MKKNWVYMDGKYQEAKRMDSTPTVSSYYPTYYKQDKMFPEISEMNGTIEKTFVNRKVAVLEKICGRRFKIFYDGTDFHLGSSHSLLKENEEYYGIRKLFEKSEVLEKNLLKLADKLSQVPFTLFGEIVKKKTESNVCYLTSNYIVKLVFYDIYINSNWMNWEDVKEILTRSSLFFTPELYVGDFDLKKIKAYANSFSKFSSYKNQLIGGAIVRPTLEDMYKGDNFTDERLIAKITANKFVVENALIKINSSKAHPAKVSYDIILKYTSDEQTAPYWKSILLGKEIPIIKSKLDEIIKVINKDTIEMLSEEIFMASLDNDIEESELIDCIEKQLPWKVRNILELN